MGLRPRHPSGYRGAARDGELIIEIRRFATLAVFWLCLAAGTNASSAAQTADIVYKNGKIYTVNEAEPWAEAVAVKDGKFLVVGSNADVDAVTGWSARFLQCPSGDQGGP